MLPLFFGSPSTPETIVPISFVYHKFLLDLGAWQEYNIYCADIRVFHYFFIFILDTCGMLCFISSGLLVIYLQDSRGLSFINYTLKNKSHTPLFFHVLIQTLTLLSSYIWVVFDFPMNYFVQLQ